MDSLLNLIEPDESENDGHTCDQCGDTVTQETWKIKQRVVMIAKVNNALQTIGFGGMVSLPAEFVGNRVRVMLEDTP